MLFALIIIIHHQIEGALEVTRIKGAPPGRGQPSLFLATKY